MVGLNCPRVLYPTKLRTAATATLAGYNTLAGSNDLALAVWLDEVAVFKTGHASLLGKESHRCIHAFLLGKECLGRPILRISLSPTFDAMS